MLDNDSGKERLMEIPIDDKATLTMAATVDVENLVGEERERIYLHGEDVVETFCERYDKITQTGKILERSPVYGPALKTYGDGISMELTMLFEEMAIEERMEVAELARECEDAFEEHVEELRESTDDVPDSDTYSIIPHILSEATMSVAVDVTDLCPPRRLYIEERARHYENELRELVNEYSE